MEQLRELCAEIRAYIIECCSQNPGHLASSLGSVELIVGLHYVYDTPADKLVFDVGHQAYAHKILTGRYEAFRRIRTIDGPSGFPNMAESPYDAFGVGHSSTSISAALGFAEAAKIKGTGEKAIALIGDGAMTGGLAFEGLNNAGASNADILVVLNDNNQSISSNLGAMHEYLLRITTSSSYNHMKEHVWTMLGEGRFRDFIQRWIKSLKAWFVKKSGGDLFEALGFRYFGPIDGNDIEDVVKTLKRLKAVEGPRVLHCITLKGRGYAPAESDPVTWHAPGKFDAQSGEIKKSSCTRDRYQDVFGSVLCSLAEKDGEIVGITPAMAVGCGMCGFAQKFPDRFYDVGIEEEHAVTFSAGLAAGGLKPFCNIYSSFAQRAYDQIIHDVALQNLPVTICLDRAGLVGEDGATHHGAFDMAAFRCIPNITIASPKDELELRNLMYSASLNKEGVYIIRYPRGLGEGVEWMDVPYTYIEKGRSEVLRKGSRVAIIATGPSVNRALEAARQFGDEVGVYDFTFIKPLDTDRLDEIISEYETILTVEDGCVIGGLGSAVSEYVSMQSGNVRVEAAGIPDEFISHATPAQEYAYCGIDCESIVKRLQKIFAH